MSNVKMSVFDIVAYVIPGMVMILAVLIFIKLDIERVSEVLKVFENINTVTSLVLLGASYIVGFSTYELSSFIAKIFHKKRWE